MNKMYLASASNDRSVRVWDLESGEPVLSPLLHIAKVLCVTISPQNEFIISGCNDGTIRFWDLKYGILFRKLIAHKSDVRCLIITSDEKYLISGGIDKSIHIRDIKTGKLIKTLTGHTGAVYSLSVSQDNDYLVSGGSDKTIKVWDLKTRKVLHTLEFHKDHITSVAISLDSTLIASGSSDKIICLWNLKSGDLVRTFTDITHMSETVIISPDNKLILSGGQDTTIRIWDIELGHQIAILKGHTSDIRSLIFLKDSNRLISASDDATIRLWDIKTGTELKRFEHNDWVNNLCISYYDIETLHDIFVSGETKTESFQKMSVGKFPDIVSYLLAKKANMTTYAEYRVLEKYGAPDIATLNKIKEGQFPNYDSYQRALKAGANTLDELKLVDHYNTSTFKEAKKLYYKEPVKEIHDLAKKQPIIPFSKLTELLSQSLDMVPILLKDMIDLGLLKADIDIENKQAIFPPGPKTEQTFLSQDQTTTLHSKEKKEKKSVSIKEKILKNNKSSTKSNTTAVKDPIPNEFQNYILQQIIVMIEDTTNPKELDILETEILATTNKDYPNQIKTSTKIFKQLLERLEKQKFLERVKKGKKTTLIKTKMWDKEIVLKQYKK